MRSRGGGVHSLALRHPQGARNEERFYLMICCVPRSFLLPLSHIYAASLHHLFVKLFVRAPPKLKFAPRAPPPTHPGNARSGHVSFRRTDEHTISPSIRPSLQFSRFASVENCKRRGKMGQSRLSVRVFALPPHLLKISRLCTG